MTAYASRRLALAAMLATTLLACSGDDAPDVSIVEVSPSTSHLSLGAELQLEAVVRDADGDEVSGTVIWRSSNAAVVEVSSTGLATARDIGTATISATANGVAGTASVTTRMPVATVEVSPDTSTLLLADTLPATVTVKDSLGNVLTDRHVAWASGNTGIASVSSAGQVVALAIGAAEISATVEGKVGTARVAVIAFVAVAAGEEQTCALTTAGAPYCWGAGTALPTAVVSTAAFQTITAGSDFTCALTAAGAAYCWGTNGSGQLGDGTSTPRTSPTPVTGGLTFKAITAGARFTCALTTTGAAYCWGFNASGQLGIGSLDNSLVPVPVSGGAAFRTIDAGPYHVCAVSVAADVYCWGSSSFGEVGFGAADPQLVPFAVPEASPFAVISAGLFQSCGTKETGAAYCWGVTLGTSGYPQEVFSGTQFSDIVLGGSSGCGLGLDNAAYCWGSNQFGQVGSGSTEDPIFVLTPPSGSPHYANVTVGAYHACAVTAEHVTFCWGRGDAGQLGRSLFLSRVPVRSTRVPLP